jgi:hypothetical protein
MANISLNAGNEVLDEEEVRLAGFLKFIEVFEKARWIHPAERQKKNPKQFERNVHVALTTLNIPEYVKTEFFKIDMPMKIDSSVASGFFSTKEKLSKTTSLEQIATGILQGVSFKDRRWHFRNYEMVFIGSECVDWMVREFSDIDTREDAVAFGNELLKNGFFVHVNSKHGFIDGHYFYRLKMDSSNPETPKEKQTSGWFKTKPGIVESPSTESVDAFKLSQKRVSLTRRLVIEMDPQHQSARREIAILVSSIA